MEGLRYRTGIFCQSFFIPDSHKSETMNIKLHCIKFDSIITYYRV